MLLLRGLIVRIISIFSLSIFLTYRGSVEPSTHGQQWKFKHETVNDFYGLFRFVFGDNFWEEAGETTNGLARKLRADIPEPRRMVMTSWDDPCLCIHAAAIDASTFPFLPQSKRFSLTPQNILAREKIPPDGRKVTHLLQEKVLYGSTGHHVKWEAWADAYDLKDNGEKAVWFSHIVRVSPQYVLTLCVRRVLGSSPDVASAEETVENMITGTRIAFGVLQLDRYIGRFSCGRELGTDTEREQLEGHSS
ncbi:hypothetical protein F5141DRAFT_1061927 [Pisolithus sp. B1]|nr:hypothetical protein F5141DRAFT_1061927 [Pisolithus sp. B1]